jgi:hypothetical protein
MKKIILALVVSIIGITANAQEHFKFKGIEMKGNTYKFVKELKGKDFALVTQSKGDYVLKGTFGGYQSKIYVYSNKDYNVSHIIVAIDTHSWMHLKKVYNDFVNGLIQKYDDPFIFTEGLDEPYIEGDGNEIEAIKNGYGNYCSIWVFDNGLIATNMQCDVVGTPVAMIAYYDKENFEGFNRMISDL